MLVKEVLLAFSIPIFCVGLCIFGLARFLVGW
jgi:hypothetical protein